MNTSNTRRRASQVSERSPGKVAASSSRNSTENAADRRIHAALQQLSGGAEPGTRLPSVRELCLQFSASPVTVQRALSQLVRQGSVVTRPGDGSFVAPRVSPGERLDSSWQLTALAAAPDPRTELGFELPREGQLRLGTGYADTTLQPLSLLNKATQRALASGKSWDRQPPAGDPELREWFARDVGAGATAEDVLLVSGGQAALAACFRTLVPHSGVLLVESPTYFGALAVARSLGLKPMPVPIDAEGIDIQLLEAAFRTSGARALYLQPAFSNPSGVTLSPERRRAVVELVKRFGAFIVEDDYARDLYFGSSPSPPLFREGKDHVVYIRSLTKTTAPGLRVAGVVAKGPVLHRLREQRTTEEAFLSGILQRTALELVTSKAWLGHVHLLRHTLRERRDVLLAALESELPQLRVTRVPNGGFSLWLELPASMSERELVAQAAALNVHITPGEPWFAAEAPRGFVRVSTAGAPIAELLEGVTRLARAALFRKGA